MNGTHVLVKLVNLTLFFLFRFSRGFMPEMSLNQPETYHHSLRKQFPDCGALLSVLNTQQLRSFWIQIMTEYYETWQQRG